MIPCQLNLRVDKRPGKCAPRPKNSGAWALENAISSLIIPNFVYPKAPPSIYAISKVNTPNFVNMGALFPGPRLTPRYEITFDPNDWMV